MLNISTELLEDDLADDMASAMVNNSNTIIINSNPMNTIVVDGPTVSTMIDQSGSDSFLFLLVCNWKITFSLRFKNRNCIGAIHATEPAQTAICCSTLLSRWSRVSISKLPVLSPSSTSSTARNCDRGETAANICHCWKASTSWSCDRWEAPAPGNSHRREANRIHHHHWDSRSVSVLRSIPIGI